MNKLETLTEKFPLLFTDAEQEPFTLFGFECGDGWYNIISCALGTIYHEFRQAQRQVAYYHTRVQENADDEMAKDHLQRAIMQLDTCQQSLPRFVQIKEKFGSLCMYYDGGNELVRGVVSMAEALSEITCEECGAPAHTRPGSWRRTQCDNCLSK